VEKRRKGRGEKGIVDQGAGIAVDPSVLQASADWTSHAYRGGKREEKRKRKRSPSRPDTSFTGFLRGDTETSQNGKKRRKRKEERKKG